MRSNFEAVWHSRSGEEIVAYCKALAQELGLTLENVQRGYALKPPTPGVPYYLTVSIVKPFKGDPQFWFTREKVLGYARDTIKAVIEHEIRHELESRQREHVIVSQEQPCTHGRS
jgi:hypothetical protein